MQIRSRIRSALKSTDRFLSSGSDAIYSQVAGLFNYLIATVVWESAKLYLILVIKGLVWSLFPMLAIIAFLLWLTDKSTVLLVVGVFGICAVSLGIIQGAYSVLRPLSAASAATQPVDNNTGNPNPQAIQPAVPTKAGAISRLFNRLRQIISSIFFGENLASRFFGQVWRFAGLIYFLQYQYPPLMLGYDFHPDSQLLTVMSGLFEWTVERPLVGTLSFLFDFIHWIGYLKEYHPKSAIEWLHSSDPGYLRGTGLSP